MSIISPLVAYTDDRQPLIQRLLPAIHDYNRVTGVGPTVLDLPVLVNAPVSMIRFQVEQLAAMGWLFIDEYESLTVAWSAVHSDMRASVLAALK
jgi:hypothetical protein